MFQCFVYIFQFTLFAKNTVNTGVRNDVTSKTLVRYINNTPPFLDVLLIRNSNKL